MSFKAKDLAYDAKEPAFLQRLRGQYGSQDGRLERPTTRPRKPKADTGDDDEPTYVDEETNEVITKEDYEALVRGNDQPGPDADGKNTVDQASLADVEDKSTAEKDAPASKQAIAEIGGPKKRKQAKVIGEDNSPVEQETEDAPRKDPGSRKPKQKKKKIKLSFDDET